MAEPLSATPVDAGAPGNMQIKPPFAYEECVPLNKTHRLLVPQRGRVPAVFDAGLEVGGGSLRRWQSAAPPRTPAAARRSAR